MNKHFSLYLDLVRFAAAVLVVIDHLCQHGYISQAAQQFLPHMGREAVVVFFVLSGFVIAYTTGERSPSIRQYAVARCARIYSVAAPVLLATFAVLLAATLLGGSAVEGSYQVKKLYLYIPMHLLFTGELWNLSQTPPWLAAYWSLGYEVWYYVLFAALIYARGAWRAVLAGVILMIMGHKLWLLLPVWMSGVYLYRYQKNLALSVGWARLGWVLTIAFLCAFKLYDMDDYLRALGNSVWPFPGLRLGSADRYLADYAVCAIVYMHFLFARQADFSTLQAVRVPLRAVAAYTFTLYLIHLPVMSVWRAVAGPGAGSGPAVVALCACIGLTTYVFGFVTERRKEAFQRIFEQLFGLGARALQVASGRDAVVKPV